MVTVRQNPIQRTVSLFICVCIALCTIVAQNRPDSFPPYPPDNHHCSDDVYLREGAYYQHTTIVSAHSTKMFTTIKYAVKSFKQTTRGGPQQSLNTKRKVSNELFSVTKFFHDTSLTFGQFFDISPIAAKFSFQVLRTSDRPIPLDVSSPTLMTKQLNMLSSPVQ